MIGLVNIQYVIYNNDVYVIEVNPRSSRTVPYISKVTGVPMVDIATKIMLGSKLCEMGYGSGLYRKAIMSRSRFRCSALRSCTMWTPSLDLK